MINLQQQIGFGATAQSSGKPLPTKKSNPCPVCGDMGGKCRTFAHEPIVLCGNEHSGEVGGYRFVKPSRNSLWSVFAPVDGESNGDDWRRRLEDRDRTNRLKVVAIAKRKPVADRDKEYRSEAATLRQLRRESLKARGLTDAEINWAIFHHYLWDKGAGFAIAALSLDGHIQGCQIARDNREDGSPKYIWDSKDGSGQLPDSGEMPIAYFKHPACDLSKPIKIIACDAFLKSLVAGIKHWRTGYFQTVFIGAPGCNFQPIQLKSLLETLNPVSMTYAPDAGDVGNPGIMGAIATFAERCTAVGYEPDVIWWGQVSKPAPDLDDLSGDEYESAKRLTIAEFLELAPKPASGQGFKSVDGGKTGETSKRDWAIAKRLIDFNQHLSLLEKDYKITRKDDAERDVAYYEGRTPEFSQALIDGIPTVMVRGFLAAGKTHAMIESIRLWLDEVGRRQQVIWITGRNGLLFQTEQRLSSVGLPVYHFQDDVKLYGDMLHAGEPGVYAFCDVGLAEYHASNIKPGNCLVVTDEFAAIRANAPSKSKTFEQFKDLLSRARQLVVLDAFLGDIDCRILSKFRQGDRLILDQIPSKAPKSIRLAECRNQGGEISFSHDGILFSVLDSWFKGRSLGEDERYIAVADSLLSAKIAKLYAIENCGLKESEVLLICSETVELTHETMPDPDAMIRITKAKLVLFTPTVESGVDSQTPFTAGLAMFCGVLSGTGAMQLLGRARQCNDWIVSAPRRSINPDQPRMSEAKIQKILSRLPETLEESGMAGDSRSDGWAVWEREKKAVQSAYNSEFICHLLKEHYETVEVTEEFASDSKRWIEFVQRVKAEDAVKVLSADRENGLAMIEEEKPPSKDHHVWDVKLAQGFEQHPKLWAKAVSDFKNGCGMDKMEAIAWARTLLKTDALNSLKRYVQATDHNLDDDNSLDERVSRVGSNYASQAFKQLQNQSLYRTLNLEGLALMSDVKVSAESVDESAFDARSPKIQALWKRFQASPRLTKLFPTVETIQDFWRAIKLCMRYFSFKPVANTARTERAENPMYFVGWLKRAESGSKFFVQNFALIIESVRDRLEVERLERRKGNSHTPPGQQRRATA